MSIFFSTVLESGAKARMRGGAPPIVLGQDGDPWDSGPAHFELRVRRARLGLLVGLIAILMIFVSFSSAYIVRQGLPTLDSRTNTLVHDWFPVPLPGLLFLNTLVLLVSSGTMEMARRQIMRDAVRSRAGSLVGVRHGDEWGIPWLALTVLFGLSFLVGQWRVWQQLAASGFYVSSNPSSSFVYLLTGTHGVHLLGGVLALLAAGGAPLLRRPLESRAIVVDVVGWYWHSMAVLWVYILCLLEFAR
jgi:cytochrome c oxidase subunit 3